MNRLTSATRELPACPTCAGTTDRVELLQRVSVVMPCLHKVRVTIGPGDFIGLASVE